ncbi:hypothetical protein JQK87_05785 [Streptomyces sp. G44]|uniref:hypothetical protein n=1 Tax=Streptomyces sp. G44 TaxID=2807632 RepID=UPI0019610463|nr:hypothetical protein [Streptomyces sp. G44]MBM7167928.1 hypothetical protein [Streptomyces sp. G44]
MTVPDQDGFDALMTAITEDPVPEEVLRDPALAAEHAAAVADVALLRTRLAEIGGALAAAPEAPSSERVVPLRASRTARQRFTVALGAAAAAVAAVTVIGGMGRLALDAAGGAGAGGGADGSGAKAAAPDERGDGSGRQETALTAEGFVACSRLIVEGTVTAVDAVPGTARDRITLKVTRFIKPASGGDRTVTFPMSQDVDPRLEKGDRALITVPQGAAEPDNWATGGDGDELRRMILKALPGSADIRCRK